MGYRAALRHEAYSCFNGRWFRVSLFVAAGLAIAAGVEGVVREFHWYNVDSFYLSGHSAYSAWMVANCPIATLPTVFFYLLPFIVLIPFAWSFRGERMSGYDMQVISRISRRDRMLAKGIVVFGSAALITIVAHGSISLRFLCFFHFELRFLKRFLRWVSLRNASSATCFIRDLFYMCLRSPR